MPLILFESSIPINIDPPIAFAKATISLSIFATYLQRICDAFKIKDMIEHDLKLAIEFGGGQYNNLFISSGIYVIFGR